MLVITWKVARSGSRTGPQVPDATGNCAPGSLWSANRAPRRRRRACKVDSRALQLDPYDIHAGLSMVCRTFGRW